MSELTAKELEIAGIAAYAAWHMETRDLPAWDDLTPGERENWRTAADAVLELRSLRAAAAPGAAPQEPDGAVEVDMHRRYAVIRQRGQVVAVIGQGDSGIGRWASVEAWEQASS